MRFWVRVRIRVRVRARSAASASAARGDNQGTLLGQRGAALGRLALSSHLGQRRA